MLITSGSIAMANAGLFLMGFGQNALIYYAISIINEVVSRDWESKMTGSFICWETLGGIISSLVFSWVKHWRYASIYCILLPFVLLLIGFFFLYEDTPMSLLKTKKHEQNLRFAEPDQQDQQGRRQSGFGSRNRGILAAGGREGESEGVGIYLGHMPALVPESVFLGLAGLRTADERGLLLPLLDRGRDRLQPHPQPVPHERVRTRLPASHPIPLQQAGQEGRLNCVHLPRSRAFLGLDLHQGAGQL